jgi:hypothetical protein
VVEVVEVVEVIEGMSLPLLDHLGSLNTPDYFDSMKASVIDRSRAENADGVTPTIARKSRTRWDWSK